MVADFCGLLIGAINIIKIFPYNLKTSLSPALM